MAFCCKAPPCAESPEVIPGLATIENERVTKILVTLFLLFIVKQK